MAQCRWTKAQEDAINSRKGSVLVSAAAGSGKTAVLVQRVIEWLTDKENPCDATRLLIVTFTNAAAAEMKERISLKLSDLIEENPYDYNLQRQQFLLSQAHISTIHSFCSELIRENFYKLGISHDFRIADEKEMLILKDEVISFVLNDIYEKDKNNFADLIDAFVTDKDDKKLTELINNIYEFIRSHTFPKDWLFQKACMYENIKDVSTTLWGNVIIDYSLDAINYCIELTQNSLKFMQTEENILKAYSPAFSSDLYSLENLKENLENPSWDIIANLLENFKFENLKRISSSDNEFVKLKVLENRAKVKDIIKELKALFICSNEECLEDIKRLKPVIFQLFDLVDNFSQRLDELKRSRKIVDFGDLEHLTLKLLVNKTENGYEKTEYASELSKKFSQIMVDEYQDTNEAQDMIFRMLSKNESNLFMVGDVKQSIYGFRQAMPQIFLSRKHKYKLYDKLKEEYPAKIILDKNFRSRKGVIDSVNFVFQLLMSESIGDINYNEEEKLVSAANYFQKESSDVLLKIIEAPPDKNEDMDVLEARYIAKFILEKIGQGYKIQDGDNLREVTFGDFCILLRNANKHIKDFVKEMELMGVPTFSEKTEGFFSSKEIATILSLLRVIDNPIQDIPLTSVLMSSIYGFTSDDIASIRAKNKNVPLYFALKEYTEDGDKKALNFLKDIEAFRRVASTMPSDKFINYLYEKTFYLSTVQTMKNGKLRLLNLKLLLEYARNYEASGYKGVTGFIRFIDKLQERRYDLSGASKVSQNSNAVRIMSIHKSKGLEFPICILANCSRKFIKDYDEVLLDSNLGIGMKLKDKDKIFQYTTLPRDAILISTQGKGISEELRILYVAMTRAKEQLVIVSTIKDAEKTLQKLSSKISNSNEISPYVIRNVKSFSEWILLCATLHQSGAQLRNLADVSPGAILDCESNWDIEIVKPISDSIEENNEEIKEEISVPIDLDLIEKINKRLDYKYRYSELLTLPTKVTVSDLAAKSIDEIYNFENTPRFIISNEEGNSGISMSGAQRGTALHTFLQFIDFNIAVSDIKTHLNELVQKGFLTTEQAKVINIKKIEAFLQSSLVKRILRSNNVLREFKFTINIKAGEIGQNLPRSLQDEKIILQGAIDCLFEEDGEFVIVDYKSDKVDDIKNLSEKYSKQILLYKRALEECTGKTVKECVLYSFHKNNFILV